MIIADAGYRTPAIARRLLLDGIEPLFPYKPPMTKEGYFRKHDYVYDEYSITTAIFALKIKCFLIAQQIEMAIVNTKAVDIFAVIVPRNLNAQKAKIM